MKSRDSPRRKLADIALFAGMTADALASLETRGLWRTYAPDEEILGYHTDTTDACVLASGRARVMMYSAEGRPVDFRRIGPGELFGEFSAIDGQPRSAFVEAVTEALVFRMSASTFWTLIDSQPAFRAAMLRNLVGLCRSLTARIFEFSTLAVNNRIHAELLRRAGGGAPDKTMGLIDPAPTHAEIANRISTQRESVSRELSRLAQVGLVERRDDALVIKDLPRLARMVHEALGE